MKNDKVVIRASTPKEFNVEIHKVTKFKRENYSNFYELEDDGLYHYKGESSSNLYTEGALLSLSNIEVISFINK